MIHITENYLTRQVWNTDELKLEWIIEKREHIDDTCWKQIGATKTIAEARKFIKRHRESTKRR